MFKNPVSPKLVHWSGIALLGMLVACGGGNEPSVTPADIEIVAGNNQDAPVGSAVPIRPRVRVTDENGDPVDGARVTFTVAQGGGNVTGAVVRTDAQGIATVGDWILGTFAGSNRLNASVAGLPAVTFNATGTAGSPVRVVAVTSTNQISLVGAPVAPDPAVRVEDSFGNGVPGVQVVFAVTSGGGSATGTTAVTNTNGVASVGSWTLGQNPGSNTLTATAQLAGLTGNPVTFTANGTTAAFTIDVRFLSSMSGSQSQAFLSAKTRLEGLIVGDISNIAVTLASGACIPNQPAMNETVDDLVIFAEVAAIDGPGNILGQAGPCVIRTSGSLPVVGIMQFDVADLNTLEQSGLLQLVILHEMLHVVGFGSVWANKGLLTGGATNDPFFTGAAALAGFTAVGGDAYTGNKVPVEGTGGPGTRDSHWRETVFKAELMTGFINNGANPLSLVTAGSLADLGYNVNQGNADAYTLTPPFTAPFSSLTAAILLNDQWTGPLYEIDPSGRVKRIPRP